MDIHLHYHPTNLHEPFHVRCPEYFSSFLDLAYYNNFVITCVNRRGKHCFLHRPSR